MDGKKVLVVYYSRSGNTKKVAVEIARQLACDIQEVQSAVTYPKGFIGFSRALFHSLIKKTVDIHFSFGGFEKYDLVIVGGPMWAGSVSTPIRRFFNLYGGQVKKLAYFFTQGGNTEAGKVAKEVQALAGKNVLSTLSISALDLKTEAVRKKVKTFVEEINLSESKLQSEVSVKRPKEEKRNDLREPPMHL